METTNLLKHRMKLTATVYKFCIKFIYKWMWCASILNGMSSSGEFNMGIWML